MVARVFSVVPLANSASAMAFAGRDVAVWTGSPSLPHLAEKSSFFAHESCSKLDEAMHIFLENSAPCHDLSRTTARLLTHSALHADLVCHVIIIHQGRTITRR
jgi:hypothetical protein